MSVFYYRINLFGQITNFPLNTFTKIDCPIMFVLI